MSCSGPRSPECGGRNAAGDIGALASAFANADTSLVATIRKVGPREGSRLAGKRTPRWA